jgi:hypothetical protein
MKVKRLFAMVILTVLISASRPGPLAGQDVTQPLSPQLDIVTVDPATGFAVLYWLPSSSPDVGSYVVYTYSGGTASAIDTIRSPFVTEYTHTASAARYRSVTYVVAAMDSSLNISPLSNSLSTVWLATEADICTGTIAVTWTPYENQYHPGTGYELRIVSGGGTMIPPVILSSSDTHYLFSGYAPETEYCFYVTAIENGSTLSASNSACLTTGSEAAPRWVNIDAIEVERTGLVITASYDPATDMTDYSLSRYKPSSGVWEETAVTTGAGGKISFDIPGADTSSISRYRVSALNSCGLASAISEPAENMVLLSSVAGTNIVLQWNRPGRGGTELFSVWRDTGDGLLEVATGLTDTVWSDDYTEFAGDISGPAVAYRVTAVSQSAPADAPRHSSSATVIEASENIFVPNAFTPGIPGENAIFRPEFPFMPENYDFRVWSRTGVLLFHTTDYSEGWDGRHMGDPVIPGVYLWGLKLKTPSGKTEIRNGTVTILP